MRIAFSPTLFTEMIFEGPTTLSRPVLTAVSAKKQILQTSRAIIITDMAGVRFCTGIFFPCEVETETFSTLLAEFKKVPIQNRATDLTKMGLHPLPKS